jgi:hypothetical protein
MSWERYFDRSSDYVYKGAIEQMPDIVDRALRAHAEPPLMYMGTGMTAVVICDRRGNAFKTARRMAPIDAVFLNDEAEWLQTASRVIGVREHVAKFKAFYPNLLVIKRECPVQSEDWWRHRGKEWDLHRLIEARMIPHGWTAPEFKEDSYVITENGPILVDATMAHRVGKRLLRFTIELIRGGRLVERGSLSRPSDYAFYIRNELGRTITEKAAAPVLHALQVLEEHGNRFPS